MNKDSLIIANGEPLVKSDTRQLAKHKFIIALDGALTTVLDYEITPDVVIGDFDSLDQSLFDNTIEFIHDDSQNSTDLEKALHYLYGFGASNVTICHATGWRMDHTLFNLRLLKRFHHKYRSLEIITKLETIRFVTNQTLKITSGKKQAMALLGFPHAIITSQGLQYDMQALKLELGQQESTSNHIIKPQVTIDVDGEALFILAR